MIPSRPRADLQSAHQGVPSRKVDQEETATDRIRNFSWQTRASTGRSPIAQPHFCVPNQGAEELQPAPERNARKMSAPAPGTTSSIIGGSCARSSMVKSWDCGGGAQWRVTSRRHDAGEHSRYVEPGAAAI